MFKKERELFKKYGDFSEAKRGFEISGPEGVVKVKPSYYFPAHKAIVRQQKSVDG